MDEDELVTLVRACNRHRCEVFVLPRLHEVTNIGDGMDHVGDLPLIRLLRAPHRSWARQVKRLVDTVISAVAIVVLSPVLLGCSLAVYLKVAAE